MYWLLIAILQTPQGPVAYSDKFDYQYQCFDRLASLQRQYPGTTGTCSFS
jgi:hypothetical protein